MKSVGKRLFLISRRFHVNNAGLNIKREEEKDKVLTEVYKTRVNNRNSKMAFRSNMTFLSLNSIYIFHEFLNPLYAHSFHSYVLTATVTFSWVILRIFNSLFNRIVNKIEVSADKRTLKLTFTQYLATPKNITISISSITDFHSSNLEGYYIFRLIETHKTLYYLNINNNALFRNNDMLLKIFEKGSKL